MPDGLVAFAFFFFLTATDSFCPLLHAGVETKAISNDESGNAWPNAFSLASDHYILLTDLREEDRSKMIDGLEELYREHIRLYGEIRKKERLKVYLFQRDEDYKKSVARDHPEAVKNPGFGFYSAKDRIAHFKYRGAIRETLEALRHEGTHQLFDVDRGTAKAILGTPFYWVHEGIACYFETLERREDRIVYGNVDHYLFKTMMEKGREFGEKLDIDSFSRMAQADFMKGSTRHYIYAATLVHFFFHGTDAGTSDKFRAFVIAVESGNGSAETFEKIMGKSVASFQSGWVEYVRTLSREGWEKSIAR
ncbi:MAG: hypothetical protein A2Z34_05130 [Planctomycetes bacterium RBG_16_59_8]|nr:MAG: hypothetical protein A2Z34_05130 [Planctomycetes bacterium RBG_16_59_8]